MQPAFAAFWIRVLDVFSSLSVMNLSILSRDWPGSAAKPVMFEHLLLFRFLFSHQYDFISLLNPIRFPVDDGDYHVNTLW
jgi:hypothetical protein